MPRCAPLFLAAAALSLTACISTAPGNGSPIAVISMNARTKGAGFTTSPVANFYRASNVTFASTSGASDSCVAGTFSPLGGTSNATVIGAGSTVAIAVSGHSDTLRKVSSTDQTYRSSLATGLAFTPGDSVTVTISGDNAGFPAASFTGRTAEAFSASALTVPPSGQALPVTWGPIGDATSVMIVSLRYNDGTGSGLNAQLFCDFVDDGAGTIPAALVAKWALSSQRDTFMQRLRTLIWQSTSQKQYANLISTFDIPTPVSP